MAAYAQVFESLEALIASSAVNDEVSDLLLPGGSPLAMEAQLWDYKRELPSTPAGSDDGAAAAYKAHLADLMKDAVALHNSYGGYEPLFEDDEPTDADLLDAIHEALSCYNCLVIIDDVDSLSPDDQRNVVFSLSSVAARSMLARLAIASPTPT